MAGLPCGGFDGLLVFFIYDSLSEMVLAQKSVRADQEFARSRYLSVNHYAEVAKGIVRKALRTQQVVCL